MWSKAFLAGAVGFILATPLYQANPKVVILATSISITASIVSAFRINEEEIALYSLIGNIVYSLAGLEIISRL